MKLDMKKIVVPALAICVGAAIAGSVSGTVAWYQYSTRVSTAYLGTSAGTAGNLKLRIQGTDDWFNNLTKEDIAAYLEDNDLGQNIIPITSGDMKADEAIKVYNAAAANEPVNNKPAFYKNPTRGFDATVPYDEWLKADESMYVQIPLEVAFIEYDGVKKNDEDIEYKEKDVYLSDLLIQEDWQTKEAKKDISDAIRVHISSYRDDDASENHADSSINKLISKKGGSILTEGYLDLDGDDKDDTYVDSNDRGAAYGFGNSSEIAANTKKVVYGHDVQTSFSAETAVKDGSYTALDETVVNEKVYPSVVKSVNNSNVLDKDDMKYLDADSAEQSKKIGTTIGYEKGDEGFEENYLNVVLTIWLEGWQTLPAPTQANPNAVSSIWNAADYIGSMFDVGIQFAVQAE